MKVLSYIGLIALLAIILSACGGITESETATANLDEVNSYIVDGIPYSAEEMQRLVDQGNPLYYVMPENEGQATHVFTNEADQEAFIQNSDLSTQAFCIALRTRTTVYDLPSYGTPEHDFYPGDFIPNLGTIAQGTSSDWDNDISSFRTADCRWTHFYTGINYTGTKWSVKGDNWRNLGAWNNIISSLKVSW